MIWLIAGAWVVARVLFPPSAHNTHTLMYPLVERFGAYNTLEPFHPLYHPVVALCRRLWEACGLSSPALPAIQAVSLAAGAANLVLLHRLVKRVTGREDSALAAAAVMAFTANLWAWSLQTTSYTLATACVLMVFLKTQEGDDLSAGVWTGLAAGFDSAAFLVFLAAKPRKPSYWLGVAGVLLPAYAMLAGRLAALGWPFPPTLAGFLDSLPRDMVPLWRSLDPVGQARAWLGSDAPTDWPPLACPFLLAWSWVSVRKGKAAEKALWRFAAAFWAATSLFFYSNDPDNRFKYAAGLFVPALLVLAAPRRPAAVAVAACAFLSVKAWRDPPRYAPETNPGFVEARFLMGKLGRNDQILALDPPDWTLAYELNGRVPIVTEPEPCGREVVFAADSLFRSAPDADRRAEATFAKLKKRYEILPAWVSPQGQHYLPLRDVIDCRR